MAPIPWCLFVMDPEHKKYILENINHRSIKDIAQDLGLKERKIRKFLEREKQKKRQVSSREMTKRPVKRGTILVSIILIISLGFAVYGNSLRGQFIRDDGPLVKDNLYIKNYSNIPKIFTENIGAGGGEKWNSYRPLQMLSYMMDYSLWKLNVTGYHLTNTLLHILVALSIYWLINILYGDNLLSLFTSVFFVAHPIHTEAVAYISGRADPLALLFMLICLILYIKNLDSKNMGLSLLILLTYVLALFSREHSLILPVLLALYHFTFKKKLNIKIFISILIISLVYILLRVTVLRAIHANIVYPTTLLERIPGLFVAITNYLKLMLLPFSLHAEYGDKLFNFGHPEAMFGIVILFLLIIYTLRMRNTNKLVFFSLSWFFITLLPQSNLYPINAYMAEHWLYIPSIGLFLILAKGLSYLYRRKEFQIITIVIAVGLLAFYSYLTIRQNNDYWKEPIAFYERTLKYVTDNWRVPYNLANIYMDMGKYERAVALYEKAIEVNPKSVDAYNNLAAIYLKIGREEGLIDLLKKAIEINPRYVNAYNNLGIAYTRLGKMEEAISSFKKAIEIDPTRAEAYNNLGIAYVDIGKNEEAIEPIKKAIEINPKYADAYSNLGRAYINIGDRAKAIGSYKKAIEINPDLVMAHNNLAVAYYDEKQYALAIEHCDRAIELGYKVHPEFLKLLEPYRK